MTERRVTEMEVFDHLLFYLELIENLEDFLDDELIHRYLKIVNSISEISLKKQIIPQILLHKDPSKAPAQHQGRSASQSVPDFHHFQSV